MYYQIVTLYKTGDYDNKFMSFFVLTKLQITQLVEDLAKPAEERKNFDIELAENLD